MRKELKLSSLWGNSFLFPKLINGEQRADIHLSMRNKLCKVL